MPQALVRTYQNNPQLNAERARQRGTDEGVSQALAGYRPQLLATLTGGLQQVRRGAHLRAMPGTACARRRGSRSTFKTAA